MNGDVPAGSVVCKVCSKPIRNPYTLPCGHTFCLQPCLLPNVKAGSVRCNNCEKVYSVNELNFESKILDPQKSRLSRLESGESTTRCSACHRAKQLSLCKHCQLNVCQQCLEHHFSSLQLVVQVKLNLLARLKKNLMSRKAQLDTQMQEDGGIVDQIEKAVQELITAAQTSLGTAMSKLEMVEVSGVNKNKDLLLRISELYAKAIKIPNDFLELDNITNMSTALAKLKSLERMRREGESLNALMRELQPLPLTKIELSDKIEKICLQLNNFSLIIGPGMVPLSDILPHVQSVTRRNLSVDSTQQDIKSKRTLYVGGLSKNHTEEQLRGHFCTYGVLEDCYISKSRRKKSKGFAFVTFKEAASAARALADKEHHVNGSLVWVKPSTGEKARAGSVVATPAPTPHVVTDTIVNRTESSKIDSESCGCSENVHKLKLYVGNLDPLKSTKEKLKAYFSQYGEVKVIEVTREPGSGEPRGMAFVTMAKLSDVEAVFNACPHEIDGKEATVQYSHPRNLKKKTMSEKVTESAGQLLIQRVPYGTTRQDILRTFAKYGGITKLEVDLRKCEACVTFATADALKLAVSASPNHLNGVELLTSVRETGNTGIEASDKRSRTLRVSDISSATKDADLKKYFSRFGSVLSSTIVTRGSERFGLVVMTTHLQAVHAISSWAHCVGGNYLTVCAASGEDEKLRRNQLNKRGCRSTSKAVATVKENTLNAKFPAKPEMLSNRPKNSTTTPSIAKPNLDQNINENPLKPTPSSRLRGLLSESKSHLQYSLLELEPTSRTNKGRILTDTTSAFRLSSFLPPALPVRISSSEKKLSSPQMIPEQPSQKVITACVGDKYNILRDVYPKILLPTKVRALLNDSKNSSSEREQGLSKSGLLTPLKSSYTQPQVQRISSSGTSKTTSPQPDQTNNSLVCERGRASGISMDEIHRDFQTKENNSQGKSDANLPSSPKDDITTNKTKRGLLDFFRFRI